ncbi:Branched-chain-amino-acid aminotransferase, mitochondrial [Wickerhamiella sorbophila]|uniref:Branched-chain-amino-acid aminotransferase n=1 Tax=Wickerhamiella sorbophila TaxID=45607 RepID=A0A2T0FND3_9ASCO|nr:Branched-chain-amino-acid aminotransferase, mitochondrial [Wickerhamiella sorbophila]PRT56496.1 Branched-chain-amino-acid aminotransferase, mitochondrial [Wickerhamiella sorbophila]
MNFVRRLSTKTTASLDASKLKLNLTSSPKALPPADKLVFGKTFSNHMLIVDWTAEAGWGIPEIKPYGPFSMDPSSCVLHYAFECFEGQKAFRDASGNIRLFRPEKNMERLNKSADRICLPTFDIEQGVKLIEEFVKVEKDFVPQEKGYSLYLRPSIIGTQNSLGVSPPNSARLFVIASPVGPYYATGFKAVRLEATDSAVRAWPGGVGNRKLGANYAPCVKPQLDAAKRGFQQNLWLFEGYLTEVGTMNLFLVFQNADGKKELTTAPLDGTILEGITRLSILELARERLDPKEWDVTERKVHINEVMERAKKGELIEMFGAGTAAVVSPVKELNYHGEAIEVPLPKGKEAGPVTETVSKWISDIQYGIDDHPFCKVIA